jgi:DNA-binding NarL/FixJ family response regulator
MTIIYGSGIWVAGTGVPGCVRQIKAASPQSRIILISAYPDREFHRQGIKSGAVAFLDKKDLDLSTLRQVIENVIT